jgi:hypothetical protein
MADDTSLVLTGLRSSLVLGMSAVSGLLRIKSDTSAMAGYGLETKTGSDKVPYTVVTLGSQKNPVDPPALKLSAIYTQDIDLDEVDLDLRFTAIPEGTSVELDSSEQALRIPRQAISGKGLVGSPGIDLGTFSSDLDLSLWVKDPDGLTTSSALELSFSKIESSSGGPVKKVLLQKIVLNLSA